MPPSDDIEITEAMMELWRLVKPSEAKDLKVIVGSADGRFAGIFTCDADQHGDRFFVLKEKPRSKTWTLASNLMSHLDDLAAADLGKSARQMVNVFREIFANPSVKYEPSKDHSKPPTGSSTGVHKTTDQSGESIGETRPGTPASSQSATAATQPITRLRGKQLLERAKELEGRRPEELARLCGYVITQNGQSVGDTESYYAAMFEAHSA